MNHLNIALLQTDIIWEDPAANLRELERRLPHLVERQTDVAVLPEMFTTGFSMSAIAHAEPLDGPTLRALRTWAAQTGIAFCGSFICRDGEHHVNRAFFVTPEGATHFYDKRHLFRLGEEHNHFHPGSKRPVFEYKGWKIQLMVCYDLRFPVWCRNRGNSYDLQIFTANWPASRRMVWDTLLRARALENCAYVVGVNRVGVDGMGLPYDGGSQAIDMKGKTLSAVQDNVDGVAFATLDRESLHRFREKFPVWMDADPFIIND